jgi:hypothetical protein
MSVNRDICGGLCYEKPDTVGRVENKMRYPARGFGIKLILSGAIAVHMGTAAFAADLPEVEAVVIEQPTEERWEFAFAPYLWAAGLEGTVAQFGLAPTDIDLSFKDILENLDIAFMGVGEARRGRFGVFSDIVYTKLSTGGRGPAGIFSASLDNQLFIGTAMAEYRVVEDGRSSVDLMAGARYWWVDTDVRITSGVGLGFSGSDSAIWIDPMVGVKGRWQGNSPWYLTGWGMIGGFGVSSDIDWDVMAGGGYEIRDWVSVVAGYRALGVDYKDGPFVWDTVMHGPFLGTVFRF